MKTFEVGGKEVLLVNVEGHFHAMDAICTHSEWDLSEGTLEGHYITCAGHGSVWDVEKGEAEYVLPLPSLSVYPVEVRGEDVYVKL